MKDTAAPIKLLIDNKTLPVIYWNWFIRYITFKLPKK